MNNVRQPYCPITEPRPTTPQTQSELAPLLANLRANQPFSEPITFPRGTLLPDGRLDLCKQNLGVAGCIEVATALQNNQQVKSLLLGTNGIGDAGAAAVADLIRSNKHLEVIYLGCNAITSVGAASLTAALAENSAVTGLWLKRNPLGENGARHIAALLQSGTALQTLDLVNTNPGKTGLDASLDALINTNHTIERLYLGGNQLDATTAPRLAELLCRQPCLKSLFLNVNNLGDDGVQILAVGLRDNQTLQELGLASNGLTAKGASSLWEPLANHPALRFLDLGFSPATWVLGAAPNTLGEAGLQAAAHFLRYNTTLQRLDLRGNGCSASGHLALREALVHNLTLQQLKLDGTPDPLLTQFLARNMAGKAETVIPSRAVRLIKSVYR